MSQRGTTLLRQGDTIKVCRWIGTRTYCIEFNEEVSAKDLCEYWTIDDEMFKKLGRSTKILNDD